jgi:hypothetical protein
MKVEVAESLIFSWLRHVRGCPIAQANWKPSSTWPIRREEGLASDFERMRETTHERLGFEVFKQSGFHQFMRQAEIDVLGLRFADAGPIAIAVDSAFHEDGVLYVNREETVARILKKMIRTAFALEAYFDLHEAEVVFATPKMHNAVHDGLQRCWPDLQSILADSGSLSVGRMSLRIVANDHFAAEIIQPVLDRIDQVADTSELFLRAQQLVRLCELAPRQRRIRPNSASTPPQTGRGPKIGEHVRRTMVRLANAGKLTPLLLEQLMEPLYCKRTFNLGYPFLKTVDPAKLPHEQRLDERGYSRYWSQPVRVGSRTFFACSQWVEPQRPAFDRWVGALEAAQTADCDRGLEDVNSATRPVRSIRQPAQLQTLK